MTAAIILLSLALAQHASQAPTPRSEESYVLGPNDRILVSCPGTEEFTNQPVRIDTDGHVRLPFIGRVQLAGLTVTRAEQQIARQLSKFVQHPEVEISVLETHSQPVSVLGAVKNPGSYQLSESKTLAEVLAAAGGLRPDAGRTITLTRSRTISATPGSTSEDPSPSKSTVLELDLEDVIRGGTSASRLDLVPHDVIFVSQAPLIYVVGQVHRPGGFPILGGSDCSVLQAISLAEGLDRTAAPKKALILRKQAAPGRLEIPINVERILSGHAPDTPLEPNDVLFIPNNAAKAAGMKTLDMILQTTAGMAIYGRY